MAFRVALPRGAARIRATAGACVSRRSRLLGFGSAALLVVAGAVSAAAIGGGLGDGLALVLIGLGAVEATSLVFLEVGLSEDRERDAEQRARDRAAERRERPPRSGRIRLDRSRSRGHRRRLR